MASTLPVLKLDLSIKAEDIRWITNTDDLYSWQALPEKDHLPKVWSPLTLTEHHVKVLSQDFSALPNRVKPDSHLEGRGVS